jgi:hypothetical protein
MYAPRSPSLYRKRDMLPSNRFGRFVLGVWEGLGARIVGDEPQLGDVAVLVGVF